MKIHTTTILTALGALIIGSALGYTLGKSSTPAANPHDMEGMNMGSMMMNMNAGLVGKSGDEFDKEFLSEMIVHHQGAVSMAQAALLHAKHSEIKQLSQDIITAQNKEIAEMTSWLNNWYPGATSH